MYYVIFGRDADESLERRTAARPEHLMRLRTLQQEGRLLTAGPFPAIDGEDPGEAGFNGSLIIAEFESLAAATGWAQADPYVGAGVFRDIDVRPYQKVFPE